uniref:MFS domain-containing protein n=1 Tax=Panagrellus redivivus TaxID=6233 RepID=A0A7E4V5B8_PANRE
MLDPTEEELESLAATNDAAASTETVSSDQSASTDGVPSETAEERRRDFFAYQLSLFLVTQLAYMPVAGSMLSTTFFEPSEAYCNNASHINDEFASLLIAWNAHCRQSPLNIGVTSTVMAGATVGAFSSGFLADRFGRKPVVVGTMVLTALGNALLAVIGGAAPSAAITIFFILGAACGGYMVTNLVLMIENLEHARSRMFVVALSGWPLGMMYAAGVGYGTRNWRHYHAVVALTAAAFCLVLEATSYESIRWLIHHNYLMRADKVQLKIDSRNSKANAILPKGMQSQKTLPEKMPSLKALDRQSVHNSSFKKPPQRKYSYIDLFRHKLIRRPLLALLYCFTASSIVSFGFYFSVGVLPGNRFVNLAAMGALKLALGFLPFLVSPWLGRRPIIVSSVGLAALCAWAYAVSVFGLGLSAHWTITILGLLVTAAMDPTWKINHLYSAELFPTPVRNMARALCNVGSRLGSLFAPFLVYSSQWFDNIHILVFAVLLSIQLVVVVCVFPETKDCPLPEDISDLVARQGEKLVQIEEKTRLRELTDVA